MRKFLVRLGMVAGGLVLGSLVAEAGWRVYLYGARGLSYTQVNSMRLFPRSGLPKPSKLGELNYELHPNLETHYQMAPVRTNSVGLRDREYALEKPPKTWRIAFIGDSFTFGPGVPIEDVFHSRVEEALNAEGRDLNYECISFGVPGYGLDDYHEVIQHKALAYEPDLIFIGLCGNDKDQHKKHPPKWYTKSVANPFWELGWVTEVRKRFGAKGSSSNPHIENHPPSTEPDPAKALEDLEVSFGPNSDWTPLDSVAGESRKKELRKSNQRYMRGQYTRIQALAKEHGVPVVTCYLTTAYVEQKTGGINAFAWRKLAAEQGFGFLGTRGLFHNTHPLDVTIFRGDSHPNSDANQRYAEAMLAYLNRHRLLGS